MFTRTPWSDGEEEVPTQKKRKEKCKRKDQTGVGNVVDLFATTTLTSNKVANLFKKHQDCWQANQQLIDTEKAAKDPIENQRLQAIIVGCLRALDRLFKAGLAKSTQCNHCNEKEADIDHVLWLCPKWEKQRRPYVEALANYIEKVGQTSEERKQYITETMKLPCVHKCGVIPEADYFTQGGAPIPPKKAPEALRTGETKTFLSRQRSGHTTMTRTGSLPTPTVPLCTQTTGGEEERHGESSTPMTTLGTEVSLFVTKYRRCTELSLKLCTMS